MIDELFSFTNSQKVLGFLIRDPGKHFLAREIQSSTKVSKAGINAALRNLMDEKLVIREKRGNVYFYHVEINNPLVKQLKVLQTLIWIQPLISKLKNASKKIILYGSCARGEDTPASDIDLFIVTDSEDQAEKIAKQHKIKSKVQFVFRTPLAFVEMEKKDREFLLEVSRGLVLWEENE